VIENIT